MAYLPAPFAGLVLLFRVGEQGACLTFFAVRCQRVVQNAVTANSAGWRSILSERNKFKMVRPRGLKTENCVKTAATMKKLPCLTTHCKNP
jgi:hypothetical protein